MSSFKDELAEYAALNVLDADDRAHLKRWIKYIDDEGSINRTAWEDITENARLIIEYALEARRVAEAAQNNVNLPKRKSEDEHKAAEDAAKCAKALADYYRSQSRYDLHFWESVSKELGPPEELIALHDREAEVLSNLVPQIRAAKLVRQGKGSTDDRSREKKTFFNRMEHSVFAIFDPEDRYDPDTLKTLVRKHDEVWAAIANIALRRNNLTSGDVKTARAATTKAARRGKSGTLNG